MAPDWLEGVYRGHPRAVAQAISRIESDDATARDIIRMVYAQTGHAHIIGITGPPGSGKSTLVNAVAKAFRQRGERVGILAVDPSSPFTGGAILGDRVRMRDLSGDTGIFIRSMASRGSLGGLARGAAAAIQVLDAAGFDRILVETVGAGQAEVDIATRAHTVVVLDTPGMGDDIQSIKAGILEIADILVVNKADHPGAGRAIKLLTMMLQLGQETASTLTHDAHHHFAVPTTAEQAPATAESQSDWAVPIGATVATTGQGIDELVAHIVAHQTYLHAGGELAAREWARSRDEIETILRDHFMAMLAETVPAEARTRLIGDVAARRLDPYAAAAQLFAAATATGTSS